MNFKILYQDEDLVAMEKPSGVFVHRTTLSKNEPYFCLNKLRDQIGKKVWPIHRLDRATSGVLVFTLSPEVAGLMSHLFREKKIEKTYLAIVRGHLKKRDIIDYPLSEDPSLPKTEAITEYSPVSVCEIPHPVGKYQTARYTLVQAFPKTGKQHQLRKHFKHIRHPIINDRVYGDTQHNQFIRDAFKIGRLLLHASEIAFEHPTRKVPLKIKSPLSPDLKMICDQLGLHVPKDFIFDGIAPSIT